MLKKIDIQDLFEKKSKDLRGSLAMPSAVHGYSLCIEYAKKWFFKMIPESYFNGVYVDSKYTLDEFKKYTDIKSQIKRSNPLLSIVPNLDSAYNREFVDFTPNMMGINAFIRRSRFEKPFFEDYGRNVRLFMGMKAIQVNFTFKVRLDTKAAQLDLKDFMSMAYKSGATMGEYIDQDYHIPYPLMINLAKDAGFTVTNNRIVDIMEFMHYLNSNSKIPITYKFRGVNGNHEFFVRATNQYVHVRTGELDRDDGERKNQLETNYIIEMPVTFTYPVPHFYMYYSEICHEDTPNILGPADEQTIGVYSLNITNLPYINDKGWLRYMTTDVLESDTSKPLYIDNIMELFGAVGETETDIQQIVKWNNKQSINSDIFMEIQLYNNGKFVKSKVNWVTGVFETYDNLEWEKSVMAIYINREYLNNQLIQLNQYYKDRVD